MKKSRPSLSLIALLGIGLTSLGTTSLLAHDPEEHHYEDHIRAEQSSHHAREDRHHAEDALGQAYATGDFRDYIHAIRDISHSRHAEREAHQAQDHASRHRYYYGD